MAEALMLLGAFAVVYGGFLCLALSQERHWRSWRPGRALTRPVQRTLRTLGAGLLALSLFLALLRDGPGFGSLLWVTGLSLSALLVALTLAGRRHHGAGKTRATNPRTININVKQRKPS